MNINKKKLTPLILLSIFFVMLGLSFAAVPLYDLFCRVTGFGGTTQNASNKAIPKIIVNQDYKMRFDTNINSSLDWKFSPEVKTLELKNLEKYTPLSFMLKILIIKYHLGLHLLTFLLHHLVYI